jgi:hypothetical protein
MPFGYSHEFHQYGYPYSYSYPYPPPNAYHPGTSPPPGDNVKEHNVEEGNAGGNDDSDSEHGDDEGGQLNELLAGAILKRPESMMGLRSGSGSGRSKSNSKAKDKLQLSPMEGTGLGSETYGDETMVMTSSSDSGLGLDWLKDPGLFRREATEAAPMPSKPPSTDANNSDSIPNEIDLDAEISSSSSSSTKSTSASSESPVKTPPMEFTFPSIATWGYSYQTHSATDLDDQIAKTANLVVETSSESIADDPAGDAILDDDAEETTPPADKVSNLISHTTSSDSTITLNDQHRGAVPSEDTASG